MEGGWVVRLCVVEGTVLSEDSAAFLGAACSSALFSEAAAVARACGERVEQTSPTAEELTARELLPLSTVRARGEQEYGGWPVQAGGEEEEE